MTAAARAVAGIRLTIDPAPLPWEGAHAAAIEAHWAGAVAANPALFDGRVYLASDWALGPGGFRARVHEARYATLLYWRDIGRPEAGFRNLCGSAFLRTADGAWLMGRMAGWTVNAGLSYFPGGTFDPDDRAGDILDPAANILRECAEETGLPGALLTRRPGYLLAEDQRLFAIGAIVDVALGAGAARDRILAAMAGQARPELTDIHVIRGAGDLDGLGMPGYTRAQIGHLLALGPGAALT